MKPEEKAGIRVMLVDDHPMMLWGLRTLIDGEAPRMTVIDTASNIEETLAKAGCATPDVILLDLDLNGESTLDILPSLAANGHSRIVVHTGSRDQDALDNAIMNGARGILRKDVAAEQLLKAIERAHAGELWVDQSTLARLFGHMVNPARTKLDAEEQKRATLTAKERKIVQTMVEEGGTVHKMLAQRLFISEHTLRNHLTSIYQKLDVGNRLELYVYAVKHGLGTPLAEDTAGKSVASAHLRGHNTVHPV